MQSSLWEPCLLIGCLTQVSWLADGGHNEPQIEQIKQTGTNFLLPLHNRGPFCHFPYQWIYYCHSSKSTGKETGKTHLCALFNHNKVGSKWHKMTSLFFRKVGEMLHPVNSQKIKKGSKEIDNFYLFYHRIASTNVRY